MDIEDLNKSQLLLLTIMVNFVVSIATGVLTVSLLDQAPTTITQTVDRIVDHTIETISTPIQVIPGKPAPAAPSTEQLLTSAVAADVARTVTIYKGNATTTPLAVGVYLPKSRAVATVSAAPLPSEVTIGFSNGAVAPASRSRVGGTMTIFGFSDGATLPDAPAATLPGKDTLKQGQTVIALTKENAATTGIISKVDANITTTLPGVAPGAAMVDLNGAVIGISSLTPGVFYPADLISSLLSQAAPAK